MNNYSVVYYPTATMPASMTITAKEFIIDGEYVIFTDDAGKAVLAVPLDLNPVILRNAPTTDQATA